MHTDTHETTAYTNAASPNTNSTIISLNSRLMSRGEFISNYYILFLFSFVFFCVCVCSFVCSFVVVQRDKSFDDSVIFISNTISFLVYIYWWENSIQFWIIYFFFRRCFYCGLQAYDATSRTVVNWCDDDDMCACAFVPFIYSFANLSNWIGLKHFYTKIIINSHTHKFAHIALMMASIYNIKTKICQIKKNCRRK